MRPGTTEKMKTRMRQVLTLRKLGNGRTKICAHLGLTKSQYGRVLEYLRKRSENVRPDYERDALPTIGDFAVKPNYSAHDRGNGHEANHRRIGSGNHAAAQPRGVKIRHSTAV